MMSGKRVISLVLVFAMIFMVSSFAQGASPEKSANFTDYSEIVHKDAVGLLVKLGVIDGYAGGENEFSFKPANTLKRSEMAKIISYTVTLANVEEFAAKDTPGFSDISGHWAEAYIEFGSDNGYLDGTGNGEFTPERTVTGYETAKILLAAMGYDGLTGFDWEAKVNAVLDELLSSERNLLDGITADLNAAITRDDAAQMIVNALHISTAEAALPHIMVVDKTTELSELVIGENTVVTAPEGYNVVLTVDGVITDIASGTYTGKIVLEVVDEMPEFSGYNNNYRSALTVGTGGVSEASSVLSAVVGGEVSDTGIKGGTISINGNTYNGISVTGGNFRIENTALNFIGNGGDDFELFGSAIAVGNDATVVIDSVDIYTEGVIATAVAAAGNSTVLVKDSTIYTKGTDNSNWYSKFPHITETPWVLGISGTLRSTNVLDYANVTFYNSDVESNGWGVLSVDGTKDAKHNIINTTATIADDSEYGSGYGAYILGGSTSTFLGVTLNVPTYGIIVAGNQNITTIGASSQKNLESKAEVLSLLKEELGGSLASIEEKETIINSERFGIMWHSGATGTVNILDGTVINAGDTAFLIKGGSRTNKPVLLVEGATINSPTILHLMENDDPGMGERTHDKAWAPCAEIIYAPETDDSIDLTSANEEASMRASFTDMTLNGDFYNSRWTSGQNLVLTFDNTIIAGVISSSVTEHNNSSYYYALDNTGSKICVDKNGRKYVTLTETDMVFGTIPTTYVMPALDDNGNYTLDPADSNVYEIIGFGIYYTDPQYLGDVTNIASETINNGVIVTLSNGSSWTVKSDSYITGLTIGAGCEVKAPEGKTLQVTVDGSAATLEAGKTYTGKIVIKVA